MGRSSTEKPCFITSLPNVLQSNHKKSRRHSHRCPRAAADTPPRREDEGSDQPLATSKAALEQAFSLDMRPSEGKSGQCKCIWCNGTKERRCSWCAGRGFRYELENKSWEQLATDMEQMQSQRDPQPMKLPERVPVRCSACHGTKKLRCAYCRGSGVGSYGHAH
ncbi:hypothetical protein BWQ96_06424 [Gracilariopsis chorda]|uniref:Uncharacterized protein n=1 Tax=Gracilariopsis chorda TaxID=448386 RepID=A0A2V3IP15_9FLOR|nr:hypothetical protein BWQ96_06424 [Gracilariopsis chorda]|eukprot:PXF43803.1 hypothetical protein BWQ96_06424 [Gracilariopsis chorda]